MTQTPSSELTPNTSPSEGGFGHVENTPPPPTAPLSLQQLIAESQISSSGTSDAGATTPSSSGGAPSQLPPSPQKKRGLTPSEALRAMVFLTFSVAIFASAILAYIVLNPEQSRFFISLGINPDNIATLLKQLITATFATATLILSSGAIFALFKFFSYQSAEQKKKKVIAGVGVVAIFVLLFSVLSVWAYLFQKIGVVDFSNPTGGIRIYDNVKFLTDDYKAASRLDPNIPVIGPVTVRYDIRANALRAQQQIVIDSYRIDFDTPDANGISVREGKNPLTELNLITTYTQAKKYNPTGYYIGRDRVSGRQIQLEMAIPSFTVAGVVRETVETEVIRLDASTLKSQGEINWYRNNEMVASNSATYIARIENTDYNICLSVLNAAGGSTARCQKVITIPGRDRSPITGEINIISSIVGGLSYDLSVINPQTKQGGEILKYEWLVNNAIVGEGISYTHRFARYGEYKIAIRMTDAAGSVVTIDKDLDIKEPRTLVVGTNAATRLDLRRKSEDGSIQTNLLLFSEDRDLGASVIRGIPAGITLEYNAEDVRANGRAGESLTLEDTEIYFDDKRITGGIKGEFLIPQKNKYNVYFRYTFITNRGEKDILTQKVVIESNEPAIDPQLSLKTSGEYAPVTVTFDASASQVRSGNIAKFVYDFGEGKGTSEGDATRTYIYDKAGEYDILLTVVKDNGDRSTIKRHLVINSEPRVLSISKSLSSATIGQNIDFTLVNSISSIASYYWDFGDDSTSQLEAPTHSYAQPGNYRIQLRVRYTDGTTAVADSAIRIE